MKAGLSKRAVSRPARVIEIVGPAGSGKTTLANALAHRAPALQRGLRLRQWRWLPRYVTSAVALLPIVLEGAQHGRRFTRQDLMRMIYLQVQWWAVQRCAAQHNGVLVLDQGPVYKLAEICNFDLESYQTPGRRRWWNKMVARWAGSLNLMIVLDAADEVLIERIGTRDKWHVVKDAPAPQASAYLARYRTSIQGILSEMTNYAECAGHEAPVLLHFQTDQGGQTDQSGVESIVYQVLPLLDLQAEYAGLPVTSRGF